MVFTRVAVAIAVCSFLIAGVSSFADQPASGASGGGADSGGMNNDAPGSHLPKIKYGGVSIVTDSVARGYVSAPDPSADKMNESINRRFRRPEALPPTPTPQAAPQAAAPQPAASPAPTTYSPSNMPGPVPGKVVPLN